MQDSIRYYPDFEEAEVGLGGVLLKEQKPSLAVGHLPPAWRLNRNEQNPAI
jgi:hypothetical protein